MTRERALAMLTLAVPTGPGTWLDLGAGDGLFTRALARRLGEGGMVIAIDQKARALRGIPTSDGGSIRTAVGDIRQLDLMSEVPEALDGALCANVLHFIPDPKAVLLELANRLVPGGRVVLIEYNREQGSRWVPYPIPRRQLEGLFRGSGLEAPEVVGTHASRFGGELYVAVGRAAFRR
ncbi:MAG: class I SAM-dependent methyltransferase [Bacteroidota bacterium]